jgi:hypothetical protein
MSCGCDLVISPEGYARWGRHENSPATNGGEKKISMNKESRKGRLKAIIENDFIRS